MSATQTDTSLDRDGENIQFCSFYLGDTLCGIPINQVQEINEELNITQVPLSPDFVEGIMNLRGQIVTIINQGMKLGLAPTQIGPESRVIIINSGDEQIGILVDRINDVISAEKEKLSSPPANINGIQGTFISSIHHTTSNELMAILNMEKVLFVDQQREET